MKKHKYKVGDIVGVIEEVVKNCDGKSDSVFEIGSRAEFDSWEDATGISKNIGKKDLNTEGTSHYHFKLCIANESAFGGFNIYAGDIDYEFYSWIHIEHNGIGGRGVSGYVLGHIYSRDDFKTVSDLKDKLQKTFPDCPLGVYRIYDGDKLESKFNPCGNEFVLAHCYCNDVPSINEDKYCIAYMMEEDRGI